MRLAGQNSSQAQARGPSVSLSRNDSGFSNEDYEMSNENTTFGQPSEQALALFLQENDAEKLTDILVEALYEAFRILDDESRPETVH